MKKNMLVVICGALVCAALYGHFHRKDTQQVGERNDFAPDETAGVLSEDDLRALERVAHGHNQLVAEADRIAERLKQQYLDGIAAQSNAAAMYTKLGLPPPAWTRPPESAGFPKWEDRPLTVGGF